MHEMVRRPDQPLSGMIWNAKDRRMSVVYLALVGIDLGKKFSTLWLLSDWCFRCGCKSICYG
jgi:hypothetical protein